VGALGWFPAKSSSSVEGLAQLRGSSTASAELLPVFIVLPILLVMMLGLGFAWWRRRKSGGDSHHQDVGDSKHSITFLDVERPPKSSNEIAMNLSAAMRNVDHLLKQNCSVRMERVRWAPDLDHGFSLTFLYSWPSKTRRIQYTIACVTLACSGVWLCWWRNLSLKPNALQVEDFDDLRLTLNSSLESASTKVSILGTPSVHFDVDSSCPRALPRALN
jgi:hypothetical protein